MLDTIKTLLPPSSKNLKSHALCVGFDNHSLEELSQLLDTLGIGTLAHVKIHTKKIHPATFLGKGKIEEIQKLLHELQADCVIVDFELSPNQLKNLEENLKCAILDRPGIIIEIFSQHARTKESKTQVSLARMQYLLPRLTHFWTHFERQRGGGSGNRGMGEKQFEIDRRLVKNRIAILKKRLETIEKERIVQRSSRKELLKVALVGYTNAGKSTLLNALTHSKVLTENKLFATLDASIRTLDPNSHPPVVAIDTVGFISQLPPSLVASFRSTLEELREANLLVHVVDASHPQAQKHFKITTSILEDLKLGDKPKIIILNKIDQLPEGISRNKVRLIAPGSMALSALNQSHIQKLRDLILSHFHERAELWDLHIPYFESKLEAQLHQYGKIEKIQHHEKGTFYRVRIESHWGDKLNLKRFKMNPS